MNNLSKKLIIAVVSFLLGIMFVCETIFAEDVNISFSYGIQNVVKRNSLVPVEIRLQNRDNSEFEGYVSINVFESSYNRFVYKYDVEIPAKNTITKNVSVAIADKSNIISISLYNKRDEIISTVRNIIDTSYYNDKIIIGVLTQDIQKLLFLDNLTLKDYPFKTKFVEINEEELDKNKALLEQLDLLLIDDINFADMSDSFQFAINNNINSGMPVIIGLGGVNGIYSMPNILVNRLDGPTFDRQESTIYSKNANVTRFHFINGIKLTEVCSNAFIESFIENGYNVICSPISLYELKDSNVYQIVFDRLLVNCIGKNKLDSLSNDLAIGTSNDYYKISNMLNVISNLRIPDIFVFTLFIVFYISLITIFLYVLLRNLNIRVLYGRYVFILCMIFTIVLFLFGLSRVRKTTFMNFISIVDIKDTSTREKAFLSFISNDEDSYSFTTSLNNKIYPLIEPIQDSPNNKDGFIKDKGTITTFSKDGNKNRVDINESTAFNPNMFIYENSSYLNDIYNIEANIERHDNQIIGRITNKMNTKINDVSLLTYGRIYSIGDIDSKKSILLKNYKQNKVPVGNNSLTANFLANSQYNRIIRYYLDENVYGYFDYALLIGFIEKNETIDLETNDISDIYGRTMIVKKISLNESKKTDYCSIANEVINISGYYDHNANTITGESEVINEYTFNKNIKIKKLVIEKVDDFDYDNIDYTIPFYGNVLILNLETNTFDDITSMVIDEKNINTYLSNENKILIRYVPFGRDPLYRNQSVPLIWGITD